MSKQNFSLTEHAIEQLQKRIKDAPIERMKMLRLQHHLMLKLDEHFSSELKLLKLNQSEWLTLLFLYSTDIRQFSPSELAKSLNCSRTNATRLIESLRQRDFIHCATSSVDRRKMQVSLSLTGKTFVEEHMPTQIEHINAMLDGIFSPEEEVLFRKLLTKMLRYFEK